jgi:drug/metabolite transporter (DMT)-like permease
LSVVLLRLGGQTLPPLPLNLFKHCVSFVLLAPTVAVFTGFAWPGFSGRELLLLFVSGFIGLALADTLYLAALNRLGAARTGIVGSLYSPFVIVLSMLFLGEAMRPVQWAGFALVMTGVLLVTWRRHRREVSEPDLLAGALLGAGAVLLMAVAIVLVKEILETRPFLWVVELRLVAGLAGMFVVVTFTDGWRRTLGHFRAPQPWPVILLASLSGAYLSMMFWLAGYKYTSASVASVLNESASAFIVLLAWLVLREPIAPRRLAGLALTLAGVGVMLLL